MYCCLWRVGEPLAWWSCKDPLDLQGTKQTWKQGAEFSWALPTSKASILVLAPWNRSLADLCSESYPLGFPNGSLCSPTSLLRKFWQSDSPWWLQPLSTLARNRNHLDFPYLLLGKNKQGVGNIINYHQQYKLRHFWIELISGVKGYGVSEINVFWKRFNVYFFNLFALRWQW